MQRQRGIYDIFPELDLNEGPNSSTRGMGINININEPVEFNSTERLDLSGEMNFGRVNAISHNERGGFSIFDVGESSSRPNRQRQEQLANYYGLKLGYDPSTPFGIPEPRFKEQQSDSSNGHTLNIQGSGSNRLPMDVDLNLEYGDNSSNDGGRGNGNVNVNVPSRPGRRESGSEANFRITMRNNEERRYFVPSDETTDLVIDLPSPSVWMPDMPDLNAPTEGLQSWDHFPSESVGGRGHFSAFALGSSSNPQENMISSGVNSQGRHFPTFSRSAPLMEVPGDEWQAFTADIEGRYRLVSEMRQILNALRRGENVRVEDYDHDRHRDMRLDVDNMSYEELLALEERIGDVKTGLKEDVILQRMRRRKHIMVPKSVSNANPCCICREEYEGGDDMGTLDCGHEFHTECIKEWLTQKNVCPICKLTALSPSPSPSA